MPDDRSVGSLFDWLVVGQIIDVNPAHAVRGPRHVVTKGRTPVLNREEAHALLASIDTSTLTGLRDRAHLRDDLHLRRVGAVLQTARLDTPARKRQQGT